MPQEQREIRRLNAETVGNFDARRYLGMISDKVRQDTYDAMRANDNNPNSTSNRILQGQTSKLNEILSKVDAIQADTAYIRKFVKKVERGELKMGTGSGGSFLDIFSSLGAGGAITSLLKKIFLSTGGAMGMITAALGALVYLGAKKAGVSDEDMFDKLQYLFTGDGDTRSNVMKANIKTRADYVLGRRGLKSEAIRIPIKIKDVPNYRDSFEKAMFKDGRGAILALGDYAHYKLTGSKYNELGMFMFEVGWSCRLIYKEVFSGTDPESDKINGSDRRAEIIDTVVDILDSIPREKSVTGGSGKQAQAKQQQGETRTPQIAAQSKKSDETATQAPAATTTAPSAASGTPTTTPETAPGASAPPPNTQGSVKVAPATPGAASPKLEQPSADIAKSTQLAPGTTGSSIPSQGGAARPDLQPGQQPGTPKAEDLTPQPDQQQQSKKIAGDDAAADTINYLMSKHGLTRAQAAGIAGNIRVESNFKPDAYNAGEQARGLVQWHPDRQKAIADHFGKNVDQMNRHEQLDAIMWEMKDGPEKRAWDRFKDAQTAEDAASTFDEHYERSSGGARGSRMNYAKDFFGRPVQDDENSPAAKVLQGIQDGAGKIVPDASGTGEGMKVVQGHLKGVDPRLVDILQETSKNSEYAVQVISGNDSRNPLKIKNSQHPKGQAIDIRLVDKKTGQPIPNYQSAEGFRAYEQFAQNAKLYQMHKYPELNQEFRWGGYFSGAKGKYGANDPMHFDVGTSGAMAGGSFAGGLTEAQRKLYPGIESQGMGDLDKALEGYQKELAAREKPQNSLPDITPPGPDKKPEDLTPQADAKPPELPPARSAAEVLDRVQGGGAKLFNANAQKFRLTPKDQKINFALKYGIGMGGDVNAVKDIPQSQKDKIGYNPKDGSFNATQDEMLQLDDEMKKRKRDVNGYFDVTPLAKGGSFVTKGPGIVPGESGNMLMGERGPEQVTVTPLANRPPGGDLEPKQMTSPISESNDEPKPMEHSKPPVIDPGHPYSSSMPTRSQHPRPPMTYLLANDLRNHRAFVGNVADYGLSGVTNLLPDQR
jgi:hypothetical protein